MKKKIVVLVGIGVCLMLVTLLTSTVLASAGHSKIYGNANEDDTLDMRDVTYIKLVIFGKKPATTLADANYDGKISMLDIGQAKLIILGKEKQLTLVDQADRTVTVPRPVEQVISLAALDSTRALIQLGAVDKIIGIGMYSKPPCKEGMPGDRWWSPQCYVAPELMELPDVGSHRDPNLEQIVALNPDVVFQYAGLPDVANAIQEKTNIPTVCVMGSAKSFFDFDMHSLVGKVIGKEERAEELISYANEKIDAITEVTSEISDSEKPKVYCISGCSRIHEITHTWSRYPPVELAGGILVAKSDVSSGSYKVSKEQIIAWNPDVIMVHHSGPKSLEIGGLSKEDVFTDPDIQIINAVKDERIYYTRGYMRGWDPATGLTEVLYMAKLFHPDKFKDLDVEKEGNEILERFYGVDGLYAEMTDACEYYTWE